MLTINAPINLENLPASPPNKTGWPWTEQTAPLPSTMPNGEPWPKISIVTPSYNQGEFIEETIRSVLLQGYPNLEYIIIDGGSTDQTKEILERYKPWLSYVVSEPDGGQSDAINKGFAHASGFVRGYLNSDDVFLPEALNQVGAIASEHAQQPIIVAGNALMCYESLSDIYATCHPIPPKDLTDAIKMEGIFPQPATFWTQPTSQAELTFNPNLVFCMYREFWLKLLRIGYKIITLDRSLAFYRHHKEAKGTANTGFFWSEKAGLALSNMEYLDSLEHKLSVARTSQYQTRQYFRVVVRQIVETKGKNTALKALLKICLANPSMILERSTLGLTKQLLFGN